MFRVLPGPLHAVLWGRGSGLSSADSIRECCALVSEMKNFLTRVACHRVLRALGGEADGVAASPVCSVALRSL